MSATKSSEKAALRSAEKIESKHDRLDAIDLLIDDHKRVKKLFKEFDRSSKKGEQAGKVEIALQICDELIMHTLVEEDVFYPAARAAIHDDHLINEAEVEHAGARDLIQQIQAMDGSEELYDAKVIVLREYIEHHVNEEEKEMFPKARKAKMDLHTIALAMQERKEEMTVELV